MTGMSDGRDATNPAIDDLLSTAAMSDPYTHFGWLRDHDPVHWNARHNSWIVLATTT